MEPKFCQSCGIILDGNIAKEAAPGFCQYCVDEKGQLKAKEELQAGIAEWLKSFSPADGNPDFMERAASYMKAMPAWADK
ncbi:MAG: zinc ribbon domain-containing protein [Bacteroidota bacterium]